MSYNSSLAKKKRQFHISICKTKKKPLINFCGLFFAFKCTECPICTLDFGQCKPSIYKGYKRFFTLLTLYIQKKYKYKNKNIFNFIGVKLSKVSNFFRKVNVYKGLECKVLYTFSVQSCTKGVKNVFFQKIVGSIKIITIFVNSYRFTT